MDYRWRETMPLISRVPLKPLKTTSWLNSHRELRPLDGW